MAQILRKRGSMDVLGAHDTFPKLLITRHTFEHPLSYKAINCHYYHAAPRRKLAHLRCMQYDNKKSEGQG
jgi:hypothetical protein